MEGRRVGKNSTMKKTIESFKDLVVWQKSHELAILIYRSTAEFPPSEKFGLASQLRRATVSIGSNIAEGFSRLSKKEKAQFYRIALGSLMEVESQLCIAGDIGYIKEKDAEIYNEAVRQIHAMLKGLLRHTRV